MTKHLLLVPALLASLLLSSRAASVSLVPQSASGWKYLLGTVEASNPSTAWRQVSFNDSAWNNATLSIGYGDAATTVVPTSSVGQYTSIYLRRAFTVTNPGNVSDITVDLVVDDGAVVWVNGVELGRVNVAGGELFHDNTATVAEETRPLNVTVPASMLVAGQNVLAIHLFNGNLTSGDIFLNAGLTGTVDDTPPIITTMNPPSGATVREFFEIEMTFSEPITNIDAGDLLINGNPAENLEFLSPSEVVFEFTQPPTGVVQVTWAVNHGITDRAVVANAFVATPFTFTFDPNAEPPGMIISEFMADNEDGIHDEDGQSSDWIEIHNAGTTLGSLGGWFLTDDTNNLTKWRFPNVSLNANQYLLVFASGKNRTNLSGPRLHANFSLNNEGEFLALVDNQTNVVSYFPFPYPEQTADVSYGRDRANPSIVGYFATPTPGAANSTGGSGFTPEVKFSRVSGTFLNPFSLVLTSSPTAVIRYTTTTNMPTESSPAYTGPIAINASTIVRARAFQAGLFPSAPRSEHYVRLESTVANVNSDLPLMILHNYGAGAVPATLEQFVVMQLFEPKNGRSSLTNSPDLSTRGRFRRRGSSTQDYAKGSFAFEAWDEFQDDKNIEPLGLPPESDWTLYAPNNFEPALMNNPLAYRMSNEIGRYASRTRFVEVYLKDDSGAAGNILPGDYNGIYVLEERIKIDDNRVNIDRLENENTSGLAVTGGYLLSIDRAFAGDTGFSAAGQTINFVDPNGPIIRTPQRDAQEQYIVGYFNQFGTALNGANYRDPTNGYAKFIDVPAAIDHHIINVLTFNVDALRLSCYFHKTRDFINDRGELVPGKIVFGPVWDFDRTQYSTDGRDLNPTVWKSQTGDGGTDFFNYPWWGRMFTDPDFWQAWIDRWEELRLNQLSTNSLFGMMDDFTDELRESQVREQARWGIAPRAFGGVSGFQGEINGKKDWYRRRIEFIDNNFLDTPRSSAQGGNVSAGFMVTLTGPPGATIYYTLNGTDPRAPGGNIAAGALVYSGPITINANSRLVARARNLSHSNLTGAGNPPISSPWSGKFVATYVVQTPTLVVTEIMYNPRPAPAGNTNDADNYEYIELKNVGAAAINLLGYRLTNGIDFVFTTNRMLNPGDRVVLVNNLAAFVSRYGASAVIGGEYLGNLNNAGDQITLVGNLQEPILDFNYSDEWYRVTDGSGFSLVIVNENAPLSSWGNKASWRVSTGATGSPGLDDPAPPDLDVILVNEVLTHTDLPAVDSIELYNPGPDDVNVGGWFLTDDFDVPRKYRIPDNTMITAGGYLVFDETNHFNAPTEPLKFSLGSDGDDVYLFSGDGTDLTGYAHGFDFGAAFNGVTFGRHTISTGTDQFPPQISPTLGAANSGPRIGPVVISEIAYHPVDLAGGVANTIDEFIELQNTAGTDVPLFDPAAPTNTWRLRNAVDFEFPTNTTISAGGRVLVVSFNPVTDPAALTAFRSRNGVAVNIPVYGPFRGQLNDAGEPVELQQPDSPNPGGSAPYVTLERVRYSNQSPWAGAADGLGPSLQRISDLGYGNDPANWAAAGKTPGGAYGGGAGPTVVTHPVNQSVVAFNSVMFSVEASGPPPLSYQWRFNGMTLPGATSATLLLTNVQPSQAGQYQVIVLNSANSVSSSNATLTVFIPASIVQQPQPITTRPGSNITFSVTATSSTAISYQWRRNGIPINGATSTSFAINNVQPANAGTYDVVLTDSVGSVASAPALLKVLVNPVIVVQPLSTTNVVGSTVTLSIQATGSFPIGYRWRRPSNVSIQLLNSEVSFYTITNVQASHAATYTVAVTNEAGSAPLSAGAILTVVGGGDIDADGIPDSWESEHGFSGSNPADAALDPDNDGMSNRDEYIAGTEPHDPQSYLRVSGVTANGMVSIQFQAPARRAFTIEYRDDLTTGTWQYLSGVAATASARMVTVVDAEPPAVGERFYRIVAPAYNP